jgi:biopolymer transport protein ExbD
MPKVKVPRKSTIVDMTAMCDVAFLLLTFFILTAKFRPSEPVMIDTPSSRAEKDAPEDRFVISVDKEGKAYITMSVPKNRKALLDNMTVRYGSKYPQLLALSDAQENNFMNVEMLGNKVEELPGLLKLKSEQLTDVKMGGVPLDTADCQLGDWVNAARTVNDKIPICIKGDKTSSIKTIKRVIEILREREVYKYNLITTLEGKVD